MLFFEDLVDDTIGESIKLYGEQWKYAILSNKWIRFQSKDWFNMEDVIGEDAARKYYGQAEVVKLSAEDEEAVRERLSAYMK
jgi:hypothetical protein